MVRTSGRFRHERLRGDPVFIVFIDEVVGSGRRYQLVVPRERERHLGEAFPLPGIHPVYSNSMGSVQVQRRTEPGGAATTSHIGFRAR